MKLIVAMVRPFKIDDIRNSLSAIDIHGMTICEVKGYGRQGGRTEMYRGAEYETQYLPKLKIEIVVSDDVADEVLSVVVQAANTEKIGDGKVWTIDVEDLIRVRTGESGNAAV